MEPSIEAPAEAPKVRKTWSDHPQLAWAIEKLGHVLACDLEREEQAIRSVCGQAIDNIQECLGEAYPGSTLNEAESALSAALHCCLRKYDDSPVGTIIYRMVAGSRGLEPWRSLVRGLARLRRENRLNRRTVMNLLQTKGTEDTIDEVIMACALQDFGDKRIMDLLEIITEAEAMTM
jgi:hypothetical protein